MPAPKSRDEDIKEPHAILSKLVDERQRDGSERSGIGLRDKIAASSYAVLCRDEIRDWV